ncbi:MULTISPECIES: alpha/beta hydrolase [unclassified Nocardioides]|uniref:alpha/beta hydrolase family protein n=1 Tax=unclassified Nocardioides TaxID=2615069 RepID=UPI0024056203|nr:MULTISPECIES: alpha/beta hydrolase [unclassified Nocardioides]MDF9715731.1 alpha/beta hydrolase [Nocardioides sp. ChNu-99]
MSRRGVLAGSLGTVGAALGLAGLAGCADDGLPGAADEPPPDDATPIPGSDVLTPRRVAYGDDPAQYADLYRPAPGTTVDGRADGPASKGVVVVIHGGFWRAEYDATLGAPLALGLAEAGWTAWNLEYRRVGSGEGGGGGFPATLDDVAAGIDALADVDDLTDAERATVLTLGHSAGGHLAVWAAARGRFERWAPERVAVTGAVSQAGVLDLTGALDDATARPNVLALMGGDAAADPESYAQADPTAHLPLGVPVRCVHGTDDRIVPITQSLRYVERAVAAGDDATLTEVDGDHFVVIDAASPAWSATLDLLEGLRPGG